MRTLMVATSLVLAAAAVCPAPVQIRGRADPLPGRVVSVAVEGVGVSTAAPSDDSDVKAKADTIVGWDRVRLITGPHASVADTMRQLADHAWRARVRIERGDWRLGEPLFESLFTTYGSLTGPTAAVVSEGLLRCRLRRGAQTVSVWPWLSWLRIERARGTEHWVGGSIGLPGVLDEKTGLAPGLPPIWLSGDAVDALAASPQWVDLNTDDRVVKDLAALYHEAALYEAGRGAAPPTVDASQPGVSLVDDIVVARVGDAAARSAARAALTARIGAADAPRWVEAWCRAGLGRSLLVEDDKESRLRGVVELMHLPARFGADQPYLAGVALAESAVALAGLGDADGAATLRNELAHRFSRHPALHWEPLTRLGTPKGAPSSGSESPAGDGPAQGSQASSPASSATPKGV